MTSNERVGLYFSVVSEDTKIKQKVTNRRKLATSAGLMTRDFWRIWGSKHAEIVKFPYSSFSEDPLFAWPLAAYLVAERNYTWLPHSFGHRNEQMYLLRSFLFYFCNFVILVFCSSRKEKHGWVETTRFILLIHMKSCLILLLVVSFVFFLPWYAVLI